MSDKIEVTIKLPTQIIENMQVVSDLSGVSIDNVAAVILALFVIKEQSK